MTKKTLAKHYITALAAIASLGVLAPSIASAASGTWSGATNADWVNAGNWSAVPGATTGTTNADVATFQTTQANGTTIPVVIDLNRNTGGISFGTNSAGNYVIGSTGANSLLLSSGGTVQILNTVTVGGITETVNAPLVLEPATTITAGSYTFANNGTDNSTILVFGGAISGGTTSNTETLTLSGTNTGNNALNGTISNGTAATFAITKSGLGTWNIGGTVNISGTITASAGILNFLSTSSISGASPVTVNGGVFNLSSADSGAGAITVSSGTFNLNSSGTISGSAGTTVNGGTFNQSGAVSGSASFVVTGGSLNITSTNSSTGAVTVQGGAINVTGNNGNNSLGSGVVTIQAGGTLSATPNGADSGAVSYGLGTGNMVLQGTLSLAGGAGKTVTYTAANASVTSKLSLAAITSTSIVPAVLALNVNGGASVTFQVGNAGAASGAAFTRIAGDTLTLSPSALANLGSTEMFIINGQTATASTAIFAPYVIARDTAANNFAGDFVNYTGPASGFKTATVVGTVYTNQSATGLDTENNSAVVFNVDAALPATLSNDRQVNALRTAFSIDPGANKLTIGANSATPSGLILNGNNITIGNTAGVGALAFGNAAGAGEALIYTAQNATINSNITATGGLTLFGPGNLTIAGAVALGASTNVINVTGNTTISGNLTGTGTFQYMGSGNLTLTGNNSGLTGTFKVGPKVKTFTQPLGTLSINNNNALGVGTVEFDNGTTASFVTLATAADIALANNITLGNGTGIDVSNVATIAGTGKLTLNGVVTTGTNYTLTNNIIAGKALNITNSLLTNAALSLTGSGDINISGTISGSSTLRFFGNGNLTITHANSHAGTTIGDTGSNNPGSGIVTINNKDAFGPTNVTFQSGQIVTANYVTLQSTVDLTGANAIATPFILGYGSGSADRVTAFGGSQNITFSSASGSTATTGVTVLNNMTNGAALNFSSGVTLSSSTSGNAFTFSGAGATSVGVLTNGGTGTGITQNGTGLVTLKGANLYTSTTAVTNGTLLLDMNAGGSINGATGTPLTLGGGNFQIKAAGAGSSQTMAAFTLTANTSSSITLDPNNAAGLTLTLGNAWTRAAGASLLFDYSSPNTGTRTVATLGTVTSAALTNGIFGWALVKDAAGIVGFATETPTSGAGNIARFDDTTGTSFSSSSNVAATNFTTLASTYTGSNQGGTLTMATGARAVNSLTIDTTNNYGTIDFGANTNVLTLTSLGILFKGANNQTVTGGELGVGGTELIVHQTGTGTLTLNSLLLRTTAGTGSLTKDGTGLLVLGAANVYTGITNINGGTLRATSGATLPNVSVLFINNGIFETTADITRNLGTAAGNIAIPTGNSGFSAFGNPVNISIGGSGTETPLAWNSPNFNPVTLILNETTATNTLNFKNAIDLRGGTRTIAVNSPSNAATISGVISSPLSTSEFVKAGVGTLNLSAPNTMNANVIVAAGTLALTGSGSINASSGINVNGINATFLNNSSVAVLAPITITKGTIGGASDISAVGGVSIGANATVSPGNSPAAQSYTTGVTFAPAGTYKWELNLANGSAGTNFDQLVIASPIPATSLNVTASNANPFTIDITSLTGANTPGLISDFNNSQNYAWKIASTTGIAGYDPTAFALSTADFTNSLGTGAFAIHLGSDSVPGLSLDTSPNSLYLTFTGGTPVPEPASLTLLALGAAALLTRRKQDRA